MDDAEMDAQVDRLAVALDRASQLLRQHGETMWADWLAGDRTRIAAGDRYGIDHLLQAFGGMGSLNDLPIWLWDHAAGEEFSRLTGAIYADARGLQREIDRL